MQQYLHNLVAVALRLPGKIHIGKVRQYATCLKVIDIGGNQQYRQRGWVNIAPQFTAALAETDHFHELGEVTAKYLLRQLLATCLAFFQQVAQNQARDMLALQNALQMFLAKMAEVLDKTAFGILQHINTFMSFLAGGVKHHKLKYVLGGEMIKNIVP
jgi:hypothetical protein